eukprot:15444953-Heterocapsa_arctica.AAC.1
MVENWGMKGSERERETKCVNNVCLTQSSQVVSGCVTDCSCMPLRRVLINAKLGVDFDQDCCMQRASFLTRAGSQCIGLPCKVAAGAATTTDEGRPAQAGM